jgi:hypothetical protein
MGSVQWVGGSSAGRPVPPRIDVWTCPPNHAEVIRLLGDAAHVWLHWVPDPSASARKGYQVWRSQPHLEPDCGWDADYPRMTLKHYVPAERWTVDPVIGKAGARAIVLEVSDDAFQILEGITLRGLGVNVQRHGKASNSPLKLSINPGVFKSQPGPCFDPRPVLLRLWGMGCTSQRAAPPIAEKEAEAGQVLPFTSAELPPVKPRPRRKGRA